MPVIAFLPAPFCAWLLCKQTESDQISTPKSVIPWQPALCGPISQINAITQLTIFKSQKHPQSTKIFLAGTGPQTQLESVLSANYLFPMKCWNRSQTSFWLLADATLQVMKMQMVGWIFTVKIYQLTTICTKLWPAFNSGPKYLCKEYWVMVLTVIWLWR